MALSDDVRELAPSWWLWLFPAVAWIVVSLIILRVTGASALRTNPLWWIGLAAASVMNGIAFGTAARH